MNIISIRRSSLINFNFLDMKVKTLFFSLLILLTFCSNGQNLIARHSGGSVLFYTTPSAAVSAAVDGDTIYIPAGSYPAFTINESIVIYGVGYDIDSTQATGRTYITGAVTVFGSNCRLEGLHLNGGLILGSDTDNTTIVRCNLTNTFTLGSSGAGTSAINNIFETISGSGSQNNFFSNNIIYGQISNLDHSVILNNTSYYEGPIPITACEYTEISNNIFLNDSYSIPIMSNNEFTNNLFCNLVSANPCLSPFGGTNMCDDNIMAVDEFSLFVQYTEFLTHSNYYQNDLHAAVGSVIINAGSDGTDMGIYGGAFPWKDGGLPQNPHIFFKSIPSVSDNDGMLDVEIKVNAQDN